MSNTAAWLAAANPFRTPADHDQALRAARWASFALILSAGSSLLSAAVTWLNRDQFIAALTGFMETFTAASAAPEAVEMQSAMMQGMMPGMILQQVIWAVVFAVVYLILAKVQWDKPNHWIPIIFLVFAGFGLFGMISNLIVSASFESMAADLPAGAAMPVMPTPQNMGIPLWLMGVMVAKNALSIILHSTAIRGALALKRMGADSSTA